MKSHGLRNKGALWMTALSLGLSAVLPVVSVNAASPPTVPKLAWKGTITMGAWVFTPTAPGQKVAPGTVRQTALLTLANEFEKMYPGIHIKFLSPNYGNDPNFIRTEAAAGQLADVWDAQYADLNSGVIPHGIAVNLAPYFKKSNPYVSGNKEWGSYMSPLGLAVSQAPNGAYYEINGDYIATAFYYNKALFKKAGISKPPVTWAQLLSDSRILKAHGIDPGAHRPYWSWWSRLFLSNFLGIPTLKQLLSFQPGNPSITPQDEVVGYQKGILNPLKNPRVMAWWPVVKELYQYWDKNVSAVPVLNAPTSAVTGSTLFNAGKVAMTYSGSWEPGLWVAGKQKPANLGAFNLPSIANTSRYATTYDSTTTVGGPSGGFQYSISTPQADQTMSQPGKFQAVLDWLRFMSSPRADQMVVNQWGVTIPTFKGSHPLPALRSLTSALSKPWYPVFGFSDVSVSAHTQIFKLFQEYINGFISFASAKQQYAQIVQQAVQQYSAQNH